MKKVLLLILAAVLLCSPAYAARKHYQNRENVSQKKKSYYERRREEQKLRRKARKERADTEIAERVGKSKPFVEIQVKRKKTEFYPQEISRLRLTCGKDLAAGCAAYAAWIWIDIDCVKVKITVSLQEVVNEVFLDKKIPKGSCAFDTVLKHELTHIHLGRSTHDKVVKYAAAEAAAVVDKMQKNQNSCQEIKAALEELSHKYENIAIKEEDKQNALIDGKENYVYQWKQCANNPRYQLPQYAQNTQYNQQGQYIQQKQSGQSAAVNNAASPEKVQNVSEPGHSWGKTNPQIEIADNKQDIVDQKVEKQQTQMSHQEPQYAQNQNGVSEQEQEFQEQEFNVKAFFQLLLDSFKILWNVFKEFLNACFAGQGDA